MSCRRGSRDGAERGCGVVHSRNADGSAFSTARLGENMGRDSSPLMFPNSLASARTSTVASWSVNGGSMPRPALAMSVVSAVPSSFAGSAVLTASPATVRGSSSTRPTDRAINGGDEVDRSAGRSGASGSRAAVGTRAEAGESTCSGDAVDSGVSSCTGSDPDKGTGGVASSSCAANPCSDGGEERASWKVI